MRLLSLFPLARPRPAIPIRQEQLALADLRALPGLAAVLGQLSRQQLDQALRSATAAAAWRQEGTRLGFPEASWGVNPGDRRALHALALALRPGQVLEIGTHIGCSTLSLALALARTGGRLTTVDLQDVNDCSTRPWEAHGARQSPAELAARLGCRERIRFVTADSLAFLRDGREPFDLIFLDGLHTACQVYQEVPLALARLRPGGFILLHDYFPELRPLWRDRSLIAGPFLAVERLRREGAALAALPLGRLPWPTKLGSQATSLAVLVGES